MQEWVLNLISCCHPVSLPSIVPLIAASRLGSVNFLTSLLCTHWIVLKSRCQVLYDDNALVSTIVSLTAPACINAQHSPGLKRSPSPLNLPP